MSVELCAASKVNNQGIDDREGFVVVVRPRWCVEPSPLAVQPLLPQRGDAMLWEVQVLNVASVEPLSPS